MRVMKHENFKAEHRNKKWRDKKMEYSLDNAQADRALEARWRDYRVYAPKRFLKQGRYSYTDIICYDEVKKIWRDCLERKIRLSCEGGCHAHPITRRMSINRAEIRQNPFWSLPGRATSMHSIYRMKYMRAAEETRIFIMSGCAIRFSINFMIIRHALENVTCVSDAAGAPTAVRSWYQFHRQFPLKSLRANICWSPPPMMKFTGLELLNCGADPEKMWMSFERKMSCAIGKCGWIVSASPKNLGRRQLPFRNTPDLWYSGH